MSELSIESYMQRLLWFVSAGTALLGVALAITAPRFCLAAFFASASVLSFERYCKIRLAGGFSQLAASATIGCFFLALTALVAAVE